MAVIRRVRSLPANQSIAEIKMDHNLEYQAHPDRSLSGYVFVAGWLFLIPISIVCSAFIFYSLTLMDVIKPRGGGFWHETQLSLSLLIAPNGRRIALSVLGAIVVTIIVSMIWFEFRRCRVGVMSGWITSLLVCWVCVLLSIASS